MTKQASQGAAAPTPPEGSAEVAPPTVADVPAIALREALAVTLAAGLGYGFDSYAVNIFGMLSPIIAKDLDMSLHVIGTIGSIFLVGYTIGTVAFGYLADKIGRRNSLRFSIALYGLTTVLGGLVSSTPAIALMRFLTGLGGAGELAVGAPYTAEMWPPRHRALGTGGIMFALYSLGYIVAAAVALTIVPSFGWRSAFVFAAVPALLVLLIRGAVDDSPRFKQAQEAAGRLAMQGGPRAEASLLTLPGAKERLLVGWLLYVANTCGYWGITFFLTTFMVRKFGVSASDAIFYAMLFYAAQVVLSLVGTALSDRIGRRPAGILGALAMMGFTVAASTAQTLPAFLTSGAGMIGMLGWLWGVGDTYLSEFFRTSLRGTGFGIMVGGGRFVSIFAPFLVGWGIERYGPTAPFLASAALWVLTVVAYWFGPETARRELEDVQL